MSPLSKSSKKKADPTKSLEEFLELNEAKTRALKKLLRLIEDDQVISDKAAKNKIKP